MKLYSSASTPTVNTNLQETTDEQYADSGQFSPGGVGSSADAGSSGARPNFDFTESSLTQGGHEFCLQGPAQWQEITPHESWGLTRSSLDPNSVAFAPLVDQGQEHSNIPYHTQTSEIHTSGMAMRTGPGSPPFLLTREDQVNARLAVYTYGFPSRMTRPIEFPGFSHLPSPQISSPTHFSRQPPDIKLVDAQADSEDTEMSGDSPAMTSSSQPDYANMSRPYPEIFRFNVILEASTAMIKHANEIPETYLNKSQSYTITIADTLPVTPGPAPVRYRTAIYISFDDEQQRRMPATCWQIWMKSRGASEAHQHSGKLQAIECVEVAQSTQDKSDSGTAELDTTGLNGFSVSWSSGLGNSANCKVNVRFNFLSTDFSSSKGAKGLPIRLCAKTEVVDTGSSYSPETPEISYCKVKVFREHGAERKLVNDVKHVRKAIDRLRERVIVAEAGPNESGERRQGESDTKETLFNYQPNKVPKHKRTWSGSSALLAGGLPATPKNIEFENQMLQNMLTSTRPISVLGLHGQEQDDPGLYPAHITGESENLGESSLEESAPWRRLQGRRQSASGYRHSLVARTLPIYPQLCSAPPQRPNGLIHHSGYGTATASVLPPQPTGHDPTSPQTLEAGLQQSDSKYLVNYPSQPQKITEQNSTDTSTNWIEVVGVDPSHRPSLAYRLKPAACFYILHGEEDNNTSIRTASTHLYRAIYLKSRDVRELATSIAAKFGVDPARVERVVRVDGSGRHILVDDEVVRQIPERQDMVLRIEGVSGERLPDGIGGGDADADAVFDEDEKEADGTVGREVWRSEGYYCEFKLLF